MTTKLTVVGGGKMGEALLGGLIESGWAAAAEICVVEPAEARRTELLAAHEGLVVIDELAAAAGTDHPEDGVDVLIAVKPQHVQAVAESLAPLGPNRVLSIAAGVTLRSLESWLPAGTRAIRCMPNTPSLVGRGMAAISGGSATDSTDLSWAAEILAAVGEVVVLDEHHLDAVTGVSGSGPAYVFLLAEALTAAGVAQGLEPATADVLARQTLLGAAQLLSSSGEDPAVLRQNVTSPGGTTAAGLAVFEDRDFRGLVNDVVDAATSRSRELGES